MLIALLRAEPGSRRILKLAYGKQATPTPTASTRREAIAAGLGLVPVDFDVPITDIPAPSSFHVEVPSPDGLYIQQAEIAVRTSGEMAWCALLEPKARSGPTKRANIYAPRQPRAIGEG